MLNTASSNPSLESKDVGKGISIIPNSLENKLKPVTTGISGSLRKIATLTDGIGLVIPNLSFPIIFTIIDIIVVLIYFILIMVLIFMPSRAFGLSISKNIYSIFYLITSIILFILVFSYANPIIDNMEQLAKNAPPPSNTDKLLDELLGFFNKIINISVIPIIIIETVYLVLIVFLLSFMFIISTSIVRTYFALQCEYGQTIKASWWAYIIDVVMYCTLFLSFIFFCIFQLCTVFFDAKKVRLWCRRLFLITLAYYILKLIFTTIEYSISNNIIAISKWDQPTNECESKQDSLRNKKPEYIFYLFLNIMLCISMWLLIIILIGIHAYIGIYFSSYISKVNSILDTVNKLFLFFFSGMVTVESIEMKIKDVTKSASSIVPGGIPDEMTDVVAKGKAELKKMTASNPNINLQDLIQQLIGKGDTLMNNSTMFSSSSTKPVEGQLVDGVDSSELLNSEQPPALYDTAKNQVQEPLSEATDKAKTLYDTAKNQVQTSAKTLYDTAKNQVPTSLRTSLSKVTNKAATIPDKVTQQLTSLPTTIATQATQATQVDVKYDKIDEKI